MLHAAVTAHPMPCGKHADTPDESKLVRSHGSIGTFVLALQSSSTAAYRQQASCERSVEDRDEGGEDNGNFSDAVGISHKHAALELRNEQYIATPQEVSLRQVVSCIPDVDRACVTIKEAITRGQHCMVRQGTFQSHYYFI
ncbi:hypothetical protein WJX77_008921 [Trebouxia sp. C0004]